MAISVNYQKRKNTELFKVLEDPTLSFLSKTQNYIPIYNKFFSLNETNYNSINLNHRWYISNVREKLDDYLHIYNCTVKSITNTTKTKVKEVFFKMAPLIDPFKYLTGKYISTDEKIFTMPDLETNETKVNPKILDPNNSAYVDSFFSFLTSQLIHEYDFIHGIDFYGSFIAIKNDFKIDIIDDLDYLNESDYFNKNKNILFSVDDYIHLFENNDDKKLPPIKIDYNCSMKSNLSIKSFKNDIYDDVFEKDDNNEETQLVTLNDLKNMSLEVVDITNTEENAKMANEKSTTLKSGSSCSSRTSHTSFEEEVTNEELNDELCEEIIIGDYVDDNLDDDKMDIEEDDNNEEYDNEEYNDEDYETETEYDEEEKIIATIPKFPVQVICLENCENTFDYLIASNDLSNDEWFSALMQIIMTLITYQKVFAFTHNDLHTNNIMYIPTTQKYIHYCYKNKYYKVPTFGKIFKIIDFGRGIYKFNGKLFCSDSFQPGADAAGQYNTEPYFNEKKPRLEPNYSFDLCRLAISIFDFLVEDLNNIKDLSKCSPIVRIIVEWCLDDKGVNMLYKMNGNERYADFKLYKMIARCVHNHTPQAQLLRPEFASFEIQKSKIVSNDKVINIDDMPILV